MLSELETFYTQQPEPIKSCFLFLKDFIVRQGENITQEWKYKLPFFYLNNKPFCYLWKEKQTQTPYIGIVDGDKLSHPKLVQGNRKKIKILYINPNEDIDVLLLTEIFEEMIKFRTSQSK